MSRWGSQIPQKGKEVIYGHNTPTRIKYINSERISFLTGDNDVDDVHHEPPTYELIARGIFRVQLPPLPTSHDVHALIHRVRFEMFNDRRDNDAYFAQASMMTEIQSDRYEELIISTDKICVIKNEILRRRKICGLR